MISLRFRHGLGDCCNCAHLVALCLRRERKVEIECARDKAPLFRAAGAHIVDMAKDSHPWPHPPVKPAPAHGDDWSGNKTAFNLSRAPFADGRRIEDLWAELCQVELSLSEFTTPQHQDAVERWAASVNGPLICIHTQGNTVPGSKNLDRSETLSLYRGLLDQTDATLLLLDWDNRAPRVASHRIRHLSEIAGADVLTLFCLLERASLLIAVDSGPQHFARFTKCPTIGLWTHHFPSHFALPRRNTLHVVSHEWHEWAKFRRVPFQIVECPSARRLSGKWIADLAGQCLPSLHEPHWALLALLRQWTSWQRCATGGALSDFGDRHRSSERIFAALDRPSAIMVETGCIRAEEDWAGAGFSTYLFAAALQRVGGRLHSVELSSRHAEFAERWVRPFADTVTIHRMHSHEFLRQWAGPIDVFLSDSADVGTEGYQENCLVECQLAAPHVRCDGLIAIDDCVWNAGRWTGKGATAVPWLLDNGWKVSYSGYQTLLARQD